MAIEINLDTNKLIPYTFEELNTAIDESPYGETIALWTCDFLKELKLDSTDVEYEELAFLADIRKRDDNSYFVRPNRNTFRDHEFGKYEEHKWRCEHKQNLNLYNPFALGFELILPMSLGYTINVNTGKIREAEYTWSYKKIN